MIVCWVITLTGAAEGALLLMKSRVIKWTSSRFMTWNLVSHVELYRLAASRIWMRWRSAEEFAPNTEETGTTRTTQTESSKKTHIRDWCV